jgi:acetyl-CoA acetyltransferase
MKSNKLSFEEMDRVMMEVNRAVRKHASMNPKAITYERGTLEQEAKKEGFSSIEDYWKSLKNPFFAWPTRLFSALNSADGASAIVVSGEAKKYTKKVPVDIAGFHWTTSNFPWYNENVYPFPQDALAFKKAYQMAGIKPGDIDYLYVHDCMQIHQLILSEIAGYLPKEKAWKAVLDGTTMYDGDKPLNISGGRHGGGHAFEASPGFETYEIVKQIRGEAGKKQMKKPLRVAVQHNHGYGMHTAVTVLKKGK